MRAVDDWYLGPNLADKGDKAWHLRVINESDIDATLRKWSAFRGPAQAILEDPLVECTLLLLREAQRWVRNALQDVVVVLRGTENSRRRVRHIPAKRSDQNAGYRPDVWGKMGRGYSPSNIHVKSSKESDKRVPHLQIILSVPCAPRARKRLTRATPPVNVSH